MVFLRALALRLRPRIKWPIAPQLIVLMLVVALGISMMMTPARRLFEQRRRIDEMAAELARIERQNERLENHIARLNDPDFLEQQARALGLVRPGEKAIVVMPPSKAARDKKDRSRRAVTPAPRSPNWLEGLLNFIGIAD